MKIFVFSDNLNIYQNVKHVLQNSKIKQIQYYCSKSSVNSFKNEIEAGYVRPLEIKEVNVLIQILLSQFRPHLVLNAKKESLERCTLCRVLCARARTFVFEEFYIVMLNGSI